jgi:hypothetical protein
MTFLNEVDLEIGNLERSGRATLYRYSRDNMGPFLFSGWAYSWEDWVRILWDIRFRI